MAEPKPTVPPEAFLNFTLSGFRCFRERTSFEETRKVNVIAGENNTGKSTLLVPLRNLTTIRHPLPVPYHGVGQLGSTVISTVRFEPGDVSHGANQFQIEFHDERLGESRTLLGTRGQVRARTGAQMVRLEPKHSKGTSLEDSLWEAVVNIVFVPPRRRVRELLHETDAPTPSENIIDGTTALARVLDWTNPGTEGGAQARDGESMLQQVESLLGTLLGTKARVRALPRARDLEIEMGGQSVALRRLGAGIEQALIFAMLLVEYPKALLLIEEPENFLHPTVQRRLLQQLLDREGYSVVTTHSNHVLDVRDDRIAYFRTYRVNPRSCSVERFQSNRRYKALWDLGVRPSSLFESNALVWVEGPSDAIYIRRWLELHGEGKKLVEGVDYSFAYHAGSLLRSFYVDWGGDGSREPQDIVDFCAVHPNFFIVADRDSEGGEIGHEYLRKLGADERTKGIAWVTGGREVENYVPVRLLEIYLSKQASPRQAIVNAVSQEQAAGRRLWQVLNQIADNEHRSEYPAKVGFAIWVTSEMEEQDLDTLDLRAQIDRLVDFIHKANDPGGKAGRGEAEVSDSTL